MADLQEVLKQAMSLSVRQRAELAERMLASLDDLDPQEAERVWGEESERRLQEYRAGRARSVPAAEVHKKAEDLLR